MLKYGITDNTSTSRFILFMTTTDNWSIQQARALYNISGWASGYFDINNEGHLQVQLPNQNQDETQTVDLYDLVHHVKAQGIALPVLFRFTDILHHRLGRLNKAFARAIDQSHYKGTYTTVYPIKVNQQFSVASEISAHNSAPIGLEAGSKTELMAVLGLADTKSALIVCNGYKDREYIRTALIGCQLGFKIFLVLEKPSELDSIVREANRLGVSPLLGVRVRLSAAGSGKWQNTGGVKSKFGLSTGQLIELVQQLQHYQLSNNLQLLHFHLGSQITDINDISKAMAECARYLAAMHKLNISIDTIDVGGGLGVDYEGTHSRNYFSMNYSLDEYASTIVGALHKVCQQIGIRHPHIISESGRAITAHHSVLITNVIEVETPPYVDTSTDVIKSDNADLERITNNLHKLNRSETDPEESLHESFTLLNRVNTQFSLGEASIEEKYLAEKTYFKICKLVQNKLRLSNGNHSEVLNDLSEKLAHKYFCNFSLFQSLPDIWAINQTFPIMPIHKLTKRPDRQGILFDITCDSDGRIDNYVNGIGIQSNVPMHNLSPKEEYYLGVFLVGAYQEILGDMHNLFGDTNTVNVKITTDGYELTNIQCGETVDYVLKHIHYDTEKLLGVYQKRINQANLTPQQREFYYSELSNSLKGYTYLLS